ncbi:hypothetical protein HUJ04_006815 [Dendroctonus ponderosae]|uniref:C2H2-type domain-containing protein n=1 Tax=Dendroctonus ponderosae TaxID=77166 RepID=A0AAR5Q4Y9_DENPD|nr:hypothetical protein HUJ04_006815 [Dendroctonus ponderosae]
MELQPVHLEIKDEPIDDYLEEFDDISESGIVLRFIRQKSGIYSVMPLVKPDPFFEECLDGITHDGLLRLVKEEIVERPDCPEILNDFEFQSNQEHVKIDASNSNNQINPKLPKSKLSPKKQRICDICDGVDFGTHSVLEEHIFKLHMDDENSRALITRKIWKCEFCSYQSLNRTICVRHLSSHSQEKLENRLMNKEKFNMDIDSIQNIKRALTTEFRCHDCSYKTNDKGSLTRHVRLHKAKIVQPFFCPAADCYKNFNEKPSLDAHIIKRHPWNKRLIRSITNKIFRCEHCDYMDVKKSKILRHEKRHIKKRQGKRGAVIDQ